MGFTARISKGAGAIRSAVLLTAAVTVTLSALGAARALESAVPFTPTTTSTAPALSSASTETAVSPALPPTQTTAVPRGSAVTSEASIPLGTHSLASPALSRAELPAAVLQRTEFAEVTLQVEEQLSSTNKDGSYRPPTASIEESTASLLEMITEAEEGGAAESGRNYTETAAAASLVPSSGGTLDQQYSTSTTPNDSFVEVEEPIATAAVDSSAARHQTPSAASADSTKEKENHSSPSPGAVGEAHDAHEASSELVNEIHDEASKPRDVAFARSGPKSLWALKSTRPPPPDPPQTFDPYRNWDSDSQERERELEERAREQNHPADDIEDSNLHEVNHYVPEDILEETDIDSKPAIGRWYLLLLAGNSTTVRLRQKDFAKYLKLNLAARLSVEYNDLKVNRVEFKPLLVNVTIFSRPKDNEEAPLHMLADTNATLLELSGEEYHVLRFITIPSEHQEALAVGFEENRFQSESYTSSIGSDRSRHVDIGVAVYFAIAAALVSILLAVFLVGLCRYLRKMASDIQWPWRRYKPIVFPKWSLPLQRRLYADHIASCSPLNVIYNGQFASGTTSGAMWSEDQQVPVQKILAPEPPKRLVFVPEPGSSHLQEECDLIGMTACQVNPRAAPSSADELKTAQSCIPSEMGAGRSEWPIGTVRPNSKLSLFGNQTDHLVLPESRPAPRPDLQDHTAKKRLQPQGRHPLDVRISSLASPRPTVLGLDNPNYMLQ